ncbi:MAG: hypothetical protein KAV00_09495 [Phycisphaerae bacterium]|nr:hypothetical protein [Phycisphaerae bacterium]
MTELPETMPGKSPDTAGRPDWPVAIGVISVIFAGLHLLAYIGFWLVILAGTNTSDSSAAQTHPDWLSILYMVAAVGKILAVILLLVGGIQLIRRKPVAQTLCTIYGLVALACYGGSIAIYLMIFSTAFDDAAVTLIALQAVGVVYAAFILIWFLRAGSRDQINTWKVRRQQRQAGLNPYAGDYAPAFSLPEPQSSLHPDAGLEAIAPPPAVESTDDIEPDDSNLELQDYSIDHEALSKLQKQFDNGAKWFYWIAGLSVVNSVIFLMDGSVSFVVGLGITQLIAGIGAAFAEEFGPVARYIAFAFEVAAALVFVLFGYYALKRHRWAFITGIVLYALDSLIFLAVQDWWSFGFHVLALFGLFGGMKAARKLRDIGYRKPATPHA